MSAPFQTPAPYSSMVDVKTMERTPKSPSCLTFLFPQPTVDDIALGKHLFPTGDLRYIEVRRVTWILGVRGLLLVANVFAAALIFFHPISLENFYAPLSQVFFVAAFLLIQTVLILLTFLTGQQSTVQVTLPHDDGCWYWGILAIAVHTSSVLAVADLIAFLIFRTVPSLHETTGNVEKYVEVGWWAEVAVQRYIMVATAIIETFSLLVPQHYFFVIAAAAWYASWQFVVFAVQNKRLSSNASIVISLAGTFVVIILSLTTVFLQKQLASAFKKRRIEEFCTLRKTMDNDTLSENMMC